MALSSNERQRRYMERLKARAANNEAAPATNGIAKAERQDLESPVLTPAVTDIPAIVSWWKAAKRNQRLELCNEIGGRAIAELLDDEAKMAAMMTVM